MLNPRIAFHCFRFIAIPSIAITLFTALLLGSSGTALSLVPAIWAKLVSTALLLLFVYFFRSSRFHFFYNLGYSNFYIFGWMVLLDAITAGIIFSLALII